MAKLDGPPAGISAPAGFDTADGGVMAALNKLGARFDSIDAEMSNIKAQLKNAPEPEHVEPVMKGTEPYGDLPAVLQKREDIDPIDAALLANDHSKALELAHNDPTLVYSRAANLVTKMNYDQGIRLPDRQMYVQ